MWSPPNLKLDLRVPLTNLCSLTQRHFVVPYVHHYLLACNKAVLTDLEIPDV